MMEEQLSPLAVAHLLQHTLRSLCTQEGSQWVYAIFWRILPRNYPPPKWDLQGGAFDRSRGNRRNWILVWEDGFCNFAASAGGCAAGSSSSTGYGGCVDDSLHMIKGLQPELFFKMSHEIYSYGEGLIGKVAADHSHKWVFKEGAPADNNDANSLSAWQNPTDSQPRTWEAQFQCGIQTIALIAVREGVVQLGAVNKVVEDLSYVVLLRKRFSYLESIPGVLLPHPSSSSAFLYPLGGAAEDLIHSAVAGPAPPMLQPAELYGAHGHPLIGQQVIRAAVTNIGAIKRLLHDLGQSFAIKDLGALHYFLGIEVRRTPSALHLSQERYVLDVLHKVNMHEAKPISSPMAPNSPISQATGDLLPDPTTYRSVVGSLQYLVLTRPDIAFAVNKVCQFLAAPTTDHWAAVKRILRYLKGTCSYGLRLVPSSFHLAAYSDADWAGCPDDRRSTTGIGIYLGSNLLHWTAKKQATVSRSSTEAELRALATTATELLWLRRLLQELQLPRLQPPILWCDNIGALYLAANPLFKARTKHIEVDFHFVRQLVLKKELVVQYIATKDQLADVFTKALVPARFIALRDKLHVLPVVQLEGACQVTVVQSPAG